MSPDDTDELDSSSSLFSHAASQIKGGCGRVSSVVGRCLSFARPSFGPTLCVRVSAKHQAGTWIHHRELSSSAPAVRETVRFMSLGHQTKRRDGSGHEVIALSLCLQQNSLWSVFDACLNLVPLDTASSSV